MVQHMNDSSTEQESLTDEKAALFDRLDDALFRVFRLMQSRSESGHDGPNLTPAHYMVLKVLESEGPLRATDLAERLCAKKSALSMLLRGMTAKDLVVRRKDPADRRVTLIAPSDKGFELMRTVEEHRRTFMRRVTHRLGDEHIGDLVLGLEELVDSITQDEQ